MKLGMQEFVLLSFAWMDKVEYNKGHDMGGARWSPLPPSSLKACDRVQAPPRLNLDYFRFVLLYMKMQPIRVGSEQANQ
jgi:hypothetical protein